MQEHIDHNSWELREKIKKYIREVKTDNSEQIQLGTEILALSGAVRASCFDNFKRMLRVYQLSGEPLTRQKIKQWIADRFIPEHYKPHTLSQINEKNIEA